MYIWIQVVGNSYYLKKIIKHFRIVNVVYEKNQAKKYVLTEMYHIFVKCNVRKIYLILFINVLF